MLNSSVRAKYDVISELADKYKLEKMFVWRLFDMAGGNEAILRAALNRAMKEGASARAGKYIGEMLGFQEVLGTCW